MKRSNHLLSVVLVITLMVFIISELQFAQNNSYSNKKSRREYSYQQPSSSLKSSATKVEYISEDHRTNKDKPENYSIDNVRRTFNFSSKEKSRTQNNFSENYFHIDKSGKTLWDGKHWEESRFPLNIYVKESKSKFYKSAYKDYVKYAMDVWRKADDRIQYNFVRSLDDADISLIFVENLGDEYEENYLGLTDYDTYENKEIDFSKIRISLLKNGNEKISSGEIKATIIHELGHALGLGHSKNEKDLMYPYISQDHTNEMTYDELSTGDKLAIKDLIDLSFIQKFVWK